MRILTLDATGAGCTVGLVLDGVEVAVRHGPGGRGQAATLPGLVSAVLGDEGVAALDRIAVVVGPGSFTGIRAALALAHGIGLVAGVKVVGVTSGDALSHDPALAGQAFWTAVPGRSGHVLIERGGEVALLPLDALPVPQGPVLIAGEAACVVAARIGAWAQAVPRTGPAPAEVAAASCRAARPAEPIYVEPPLTTAPAQR